MFSITQIQLSVATTANAQHDPSYSRKSCMNLKALFIFSMKHCFIFKRQEWGACVDIED